MCCCMPCEMRGCARARKTCAKPPLASAKGSAHRPTLQPPLRAVCEACLPRFTLYLHDRAAKPSVNFDRPQACTYWPGRT